MRSKPRTSAEFTSKRVTAIKVPVAMEASSPSPGVLHTYYPERRLVCFESGNVDGDASLLYIGGLGEGLQAVPYLSALQAKLVSLSCVPSVPPSHLFETKANSQWSLLQPLLSGSYSGWGTGSLNRDAEEIEMCCNFMWEKKGKKKLVLMGHSSGCQAILLLFRKFVPYPTPPPYGLSGIVFQAPVCDRDFIISFLTPPVYRDSVSLAKSYISQENPNELMPGKYSRLYGNMRISAKRWLEHADNGDNDGVEEKGGGLAMPDIFSAYLDEEQRKNQQVVLTVPTLFLVSGKDFTYPDEVDRFNLGKRMIECLPEKEWVRGEWKERKEGEARRFSGVVEEVGHTPDWELDGEKNVMEFLARVEGLLKII